MAFLATEKQSDIINHQLQDYHDAVIVDIMNESSSEARRHEDFSFYLTV